MAIDFATELLSSLEESVRGCEHHPPITHAPRTLDEARLFWKWFEDCPKAARRSHLRFVCDRSLFFFARYVLAMHFIDCEWGFARCQEVFEHPNGHLDLWAREHCKSSIITLALTMLDAVRNSEQVIAIFSQNRPLAKAFLRKIKMEFQENELLKEVYSDSCWKNPKDEAPKWSEDEGLCLKRRAVRVEQTIEAWGLIDGQPTGRHFDGMVFDDILTIDNSRSSTMIEKVTDALQQAHNTSSRGGWKRYVGTLYNAADAYSWLAKQGVAKVRRYPVLWEEGPHKGEPCFFDWELVYQRMRENGAHNWAFQYLLDPKADTSRDHWQVDWIQRYSKKIESGVNVYLLCDPANEKSAKADFTVIMAIGLGADRNYYVLDMIRDKLSLKQRAEALMAMHAKFSAMGPGMRPKAVGYEKFGKDSDISYIEEKMGELTYHFPITALGGVTASKADRIGMLRPLFEDKRIYFPYSIQRKDWEGNEHELVDDFITQEYQLPVGVSGTKDDIRDCLARILDPKLGAAFPMSAAARLAHDYPIDDSDIRPPSFMSS